MILAALPVAAFFAWIALALWWEARSARDIPERLRCRCCHLRPMSAGYRPLCTDCAESAQDEG